MANQHGGAREGAGRKKGSTTLGIGYKNGRVVISCTKDEENKVKLLAKEAQMNVSDFVLKALKVREQR